METGCDLGKLPRAYSALRASFGIYWQWVMHAGCTPAREVVAVRMTAEARREQAERRRCTNCEEPAFWLYGEDGEQLCWPCLSGVG